MINIYRYLDYRQFLRDFYEERKRTTKSMSLRNFAKSAGLASWNYLKLVMEGKRNLTPESVGKFAIALRLKKREADFFRSLVWMNQAIDPEEKQRHFEELLVHQRFCKIHHIERDVYALLSHWYIAAVHELVALPGFDADPYWIANQLVPKISPAEAKQALQVLERLRLIVVDARTGKARHTKAHCTTPHEVASIAAVSFHDGMLALARQAIRQVPSHQRDISGLTLALSRKQFDAARAIIREFRRKLHATFADHSAAEAVYQVNIQLFPVSEVPHE